MGATVVRTAEASSPGCLPMANASACRKGLASQSTAVSAGF